MLPRYLKVIPPENSSIHVRDEDCNYFDNPWHFHPELEINYILKSTGTRFVGDNTGHFTPGDLILLGPNLPHYWKNDIAYYDSKNQNASRAIVIRFHRDFLGREQNQIPEMESMKHLFDNARRGIQFLGNTQRIKRTIRYMAKAEGLERIILFLKALDLMAKHQEITYLSSEGFMSSVRPSHEKRMNDVYDYITNNFMHEISLKNIAEKAHMNPSSFSRYFKQSTGKTLTTFIHDIRIGYACKLLIQGDLNIAQIVFESGFRNQAYFNKVFLDKKKVTPWEYRKKYK